MDEVFALRVAEALGVRSVPPYAAKPAAEAVKFRFRADAGSRMI